MKAAKLTVATSFPVHPPRGGGQKRISGLYRALAALEVEVEIVALVDRFERAGRYELAPGIQEVRVPKSADHEGREFALQQRAGVPVSDVALALHHDLTPAYADALATSAAAAAAVVASHPYTVAAIAEGPARPLIYEAHNVEADLKAGMFAREGTGDLLEAVEAAERRCCEDAALVLACSAEDAKRLRELYAVEPGRLAVVPNGVNARDHVFRDGEARSRLKAQLGLDAFVALFVGSWHEPNLVALREVTAAARELPHVTFLAVGSAGLAVDPDDVSPNVDLCGVVDNGFLDGVLAISDVALNPMRSGSGTNLKMLDYAAAGAPLVSSAIGARGLGFEPGIHYAGIDADGLAAAMEAVRAEPAERVQQRARAARRLVEYGFDWAAIAARWAEHPWMRETLRLAGGRG